MKTKIPDGTKFHFGQHTFHFGQEVVELMDSATIKDNPEALRSRFQEDGYLFIRGFHNPQKSQIAALFTLNAIADRGGIKEGIPIKSGIIGRKNQSFSFFRQTEVAHAKEILDLKDILNNIYGKHTEQSVKKISEMLERDKFLSPIEAKELGLIDEIVENRVISD